jgi:hypothetical protein
MDKKSAMEDICEKIATSSLGLSRIIKQGQADNPDYPGYSTVRMWIATDDEIKAMYHQSKMDQADYMADEMLDIADDGRNDWMETNGVSVPNKECVQRSRVRIDTRKWLASKLKPKIYGEKLHQEVSGPGGGPIEVTGIDVVFKGTGETNR